MPFQSIGILHLRSFSFGAGLRVDACRERDGDCGAVFLVCWMVEECEEKGVLSGLLRRWGLTLGALMLVRIGAKKNVKGVVREVARGWIVGCCRGVMGMAMVGC